MEESDFAIDRVAPDSRNSTELAAPITPTGANQASGSTNRTKRPLMK